MSSECRYEIHQNAYVKLVLHALKYKTNSVNGILVGRQVDGVVEISDSIPLSHSQNPLLLLAQIALPQIDAYFIPKELCVVGYYHANERYDDSKLSNVAKSFGDHLFLSFQHAAILLLDNTKLENLLKNKDSVPVLQLFTKDSSKGWQQGGFKGSARLYMEPTANTILLDYISTEKWQALADFDEHLEDISKDWLNGDLFK